MKNYNSFLAAFTASVLLVSCADEFDSDFKVDKPENIARYDLLNTYDNLKTYVDLSANPNFKLGAGTSASDFLKKDQVYCMTCANFDEITAGNEMKYASCVDDKGEMDFANVKKFIEAAKIAKLTIYGHTLCWHAQQNNTYLNGLIAPTVVGGTPPPRWDAIMEQNFEGDTKSNYSYNSKAQASFTAIGEGKDGVGRALKITNATVGANDWDCQLFITFSRPVSEGEKVRFTMDIKSDANVTYSTQAQTAPGAYKHWDFFGQLNSKPQWSTFSKEITVSANQANCNTIAFNFGKIASTFYFDNVKVEYYNLHPKTTTVEKTLEEKKVILTNALESWIKGMMEACGGYVKAWDVVNEPMSNVNADELQSDPNHKDATNFYWQDYLGKEYARSAIKLARQYGGENLKLFINDYNLEATYNNNAKCEGLIKMIQYWESDGITKIDGIGSQMHVSFRLNPEEQTKQEACIVKMFQLLAATGKLIKISELDMGILDSANKEIMTENVTYEQHLQMGNFYKFIIEKYFEIIPANQRYGITQWCVTDSPNKDGVWRKGEPIGLWDLNYNRKPSYGGFVDGLK